MEEIIYFELNNWFSGRDYPPYEPYESWVVNRQFCDDVYCKENKLVVKCGNIDMSTNWCIAAPKFWVETNCPSLLSNETFEYIIYEHSWDKNTGQAIDKELHYTKSFSNFLRNKNEDGKVYGRFGWLFPEYKEENFGVEWYDEEGEEE